MSNGDDVVAVPRDVQVEDMQRRFLPMFPFWAWPGDGPKPNMFEFTGSRPLPEPETERPPPPFKPPEKPTP